MGKLSAPLKCSDDITDGVIVAGERGSNSSSDATNKETDSSFFSNDLIRLELSTGIFQYSVIILYTSTTSLNARL